MTPPAPPPAFEQPPVPVPRAVPTIAFRPLSPTAPLGERGERPVHVGLDRAGVIAALGVPGVKEAPGGVYASLDQLPAILRRLGWDPSAYLAPKHPQVTLPGLDEYVKLGFPQKLRAYQPPMAAFLASRTMAVCTDPMRCLSGDAELVVNRGGAARRMRLADLVEKLAGGATHGKCWDLSIPTYVQSMDAEGLIRLNLVTAAHATGLKRTYTVRLDSGHELRCTMDHEFPIQAGVLDKACYVPLHRLRAGDSVLVAQATKAVPAKIVNVEPYGDEATFDLTLLDPMNNYVANGVIVSNSGKSITAISAVVARGIQKELILCPALAKLVWASEIAKWTGQRALILYGRSALRARWFCLTCMGTGALNDGRCPDCRTGSIPVKGTVDDLDDREDASAAPDEDHRRRWQAQKLAVIDALHEARWVICNYDLLVPQFEHDAAGKKAIRSDLPGWVSTLALVKFDGALADEAHGLRGIANVKRKGLTKRDRAVMACSSIPVVWALTGTPFFGKAADGYGLFDFVTNGLFGRPHFDYDKAYTLGGMQTAARPKAGEGETSTVKFWSRKGLNEAALPELHDRMNAIMWGRSRTEIQPYMPPKTRQLVRVEIEGRVPVTSSGGIAVGLRKTCRLKQPQVVEEVLEELAEGTKVIVYTYLRENAEETAKLIEQRAKGREWAGRMKASNLRIWMVHGDLSPEQRFKQAEAYKAHRGAGVWVSTMDSVPGMISLKGATTVHFLDMHHDATTIFQAEERSYEEGTTGLAVRFYVAAGSVDEHAIAILLPKLEQLESLMKDRNAGQLREALGGVKPDDMAQLIWQRMLASLEQSL